LMTPCVGFPGLDANSTQYSPPRFKCWTKRNQKIVNSGSVRRLPAATLRSHRRHVQASMRASPSRSR
jgi:hypothetical protein